MKKNENIIPIVLACDDNYAKYAAVTIASIMANSLKNNTYKIYILTEKLEENNIRLLNEQISKKTNFSLDLINVSGIDFSQFYIVPDSYINISTYYRFFIADLLPQYDKLVYLDCDLVVNADIANLYNQDLGNYILGAVKDTVLNGDLSESLKEYYNEILKLSIENWDYFNAGVILFNTKIMREINFSSILVNKLKEIKEPFYQDQDILNVCVSGNKQYGGGVFIFR